MKQLQNKEGLDKWEIEPPSPGEAIYKYALRRLEESPLHQILKKRTDQIEAN